MFKISKTFSRSGLIVSLAVLGACSDNQSAEQMMAPPPTPVGVVELASTPLTLTTELPGRTLAYRIAEIRPRINGVVQERLFQEGGEVESGQVLYQIEDNSYRATFAAAQAEVARAESALDIAQLRRDRLQPLLQSERVSRQEFDEAEANLAQAEANLSAAKAQLDQAQINLDYTRITSPISGRIGRSHVTEGALVTALQANELSTVRQLDPIYVEVSQSAEQLLALRRQADSLGVDVTSGLPVHLILEGGVRYPLEGQLEFAEVNVDEATGTVTLRAVFPNPDLMLLPGMFVRTELTQLQLENALTVPQQAVMRDPSGGANVWVVGSNDMVEVRSVQVSQAIENKWLVEQGLQAGDRVIVDSLQKIGPGMPVSPLAVELN